ncbi:MAG: mechanosensitive ion channel family protein [Thermoplasmatota archaeon]
MLENIFNNGYLQFLVILIGTILLASISYLIIQIIAKKAAKNKKGFARYVVRQLLKPVVLLVLLSGLYTALKSLNFLTDPSCAFCVFYVSSNKFFVLDAIFFAFITITIALLISRVISVLMTSWMKVTKSYDKPPGLIYKMISAIIFILAFIVIIGYFQIDITPLIAGVGLGALAIGLALQSTLSNFFAGIHLISDHPIRVGDFIELDADTSGFVVDIGWRSTRIRMLTDNLLIIPNNKLAESKIINYSLPKQDLSIWVPCGVAYESDLKKVEQITLEVAKEIQKNTEGAVKDFEPAFRYREFGDSNINFITILRVEKPITRFVVRNEFIKALKERFDKEKIEISWPIRKIYNMK